MAQPKLRRFTLRALALRLQDTAGVPASIDPVRDRIDLQQGMGGTQCETLEERRDRQGVDQIDSATWQHRAFVEGFVSLPTPSEPGSVVDGKMSVHPLLEIGGLHQALYGGELTRYNPVSSDVAMATAEFWHAGTLRRLTDARAMLSELRVEIGQRPRMKVRLEGFYESVEEAEVPEFAGSTALAPLALAETAKARLRSATDSVSLSIWAKSLEIDLKAALRAKDYTSHREISYADRQPTFTLRMAMPALADFDPWQLRRDGIAIVVRMLVENESGIALELGARGLIRDIEEVDIDGDYGLEITGNCVASGRGGNELWITAGPSTVLLAPYYDDIEALGGPDEILPGFDLLHQLMNIDYPTTLGAL